MTSEYYSTPTKIAAGSLARSSDVNAISEATESAFESLYPDLKGTATLKKGYVSFADRLNNIEVNLGGMVNFKGDWSLLTGALNAPASVYHAGKNWLLKTNISNVATHTPGISSVWAESYLSISSFDQTVDAKGNIFKNMVLQFTSEKVQILGSVSGSKTVNIANGNVALMTISDNLTLSVTGWPASGHHGELLLEITNAGAHAITWPTVNWIMDDGSTTTNISNLHASFRTTGVDFVFLWTRDAGETVYGKVIR